MENNTLIGCQVSTKTLLYKVILELNPLGQKQSIFQVTIYQMFRCNTPKKTDLKQSAVFDVNTKEKWKRLLEIGYSQKSSHSWILHKAEFKPCGQGLQLPLQENGYVI